MRCALVHLRHGPIGGTERILNELARRLAERGHEVTIVCRSRGEPSHPALRFVKLRHPAIGSAWRMWAFARDVERHVQQAGYDLVVALGKTWTHDVIRTSGGSHATYVERMRALGRETWRDWPALRGLKDSLALAVERRAYAPGAYRRVIANSRAVRDDVCRRYGVPPGRVDVIYNGVDVARFRPRPDAEVAAWRRSVGLGVDDLVLLFLGKGFARKGLARAIAAFAEVAPKRPESRLVVVGRDSSQAYFERLVAEGGLAGRVRFLGERRDPELCLSACDLHVMPTWYDSFGFTVLEALSAGKPVITTDGAGASELVEPGLHGEVLPAACRPAELATALLAWCERPRAAEAAGPARARAEAYSFDATLAQMAEVLERVALERRAEVEAPLQPA